MQITGIMLISREQRVEQICQEINSLDTTDIDLSWIIIIDNLKIQKHDIKLKYPTTKIHTEQDIISDANMNQRRQRIAQNLNIARAYTPDTGLVWIVEDDTIYQPDILQQMLEHPIPCTARQAGRHGIKIVGLWDTTEKTYTSKIEGDSDAAGLYCLLTTPETLNTPFRYDPKSPVGTDVLWCQDNKLRITDTKINVGHWTPYGTIYPDNNCLQIKFAKVNNIWQTQIFNPTPTTPAQ